MTDVSGRVLDPFFRDLQRRKISTQELFVDVDVDAHVFKDRHGRISWQTFVGICHNLGRLWSDEELASIGGKFLRSPLLVPVGVIARLLFSVRDAYLWAYAPSHGPGVHMFRCVTPTVTDIAQGLLKVELRLPEDYEPPREFFVVCKGVLTDFPRLVGYGPALVAMTVDQHAASFEIQYPKGQGVLVKLRRLMTWPFAARAAARELKKAHELLQMRYHELEEARASVERQVQSRTEDLEKSLAALREAQSTRDRLFANINHEIRTPLSLVQLAACDIEKRLPPDADEAIGKRIVAIDTNVRRLINMVDGLLILAAGQENKIRLNQESTNLATQLKMQVSAWEPVANEVGIQMHYDGPDELEATVDVSALARVVTNLLSNAIKFTPAGGSISIELRDADPLFEILVRDTGVGIDDELKERLFGRFEQGQPALRANFRGSGIGLSIVRELVEAHGGTIELVAHRGRGSIFCIALPKESKNIESTAINGSRVPKINTLDTASLEVAQSQTPLILQGGDHPQATLLIAEDNPDLRHSIAELLAEHYRVVAAPDGLTALRLSKEYSPDLLLTDVQMPGMDGFELIKRFRDLPGNRLAPALLLTAYGNIQDKLLGFDAGAVDYVIKPFDPLELKARIRNQLFQKTLALRLLESEKLAGLGLLSAGLAHEFRNPANVVANGIAPLRNAVKNLEQNKNTTGITDLLDVVEVASVRIGTLSRDLLSIVQAGQLAISPVSIDSVIDTSCHLASSTLAHVTFTLENKATGEMRCVKGLMVQVLVNLLENAVHAAGTDGWVRLCANSNEANVVFEITDSGPGVPAASRSKIFEMFYTSKAPHKGTGLGLPLAKRIVMRHGGSIELCPSTEGARFVVTVPLKGPSPPKAVDVAENRASEIGVNHVL